MCVCGGGGGGGAGRWMCIFGQHYNSHKILPSLFDYPFNMFKSTDRMANSADRDQTALGLHCLLRPTCLSI